jgi:hypothetical protein
MEFTRPGAQSAADNGGIRVGREFPADLVDEPIGSVRPTHAAIPAIAASMSSCWPSGAIWP